MDKTEVQLFDNHYGMRCETFGCGERSIYFVGRPDAPLSTALNLCERCAEQLVRSVVLKFDLHPKASHAPKGKGEFVPETSDGVIIGGEKTENPEGMTVDVLNLINASNSFSGIPTGIIQNEDSITLKAGSVEFHGSVDFSKATITNDEENEITLDNVHHIVPNEPSEKVDTFDDDEEWTLEDLLETKRTHAELDELAAELGVKGFPTRDEKTLKERKQFLLDYDYPVED